MSNDNGRRASASTRHSSRTFALLRASMKVWLGHGLSAVGHSTKEAGYKLRIDGERELQALRERP